MKDRQTRRPRAATMPPRGRSAFVALAIAIGLAGCAETVEHATNRADADATRLAEAFRASPADWESTCLGPYSRAVHPEGGAAPMTIATLAHRRRAENLAVVYCLAVGSNADARRASLPKDSLLLTQLTDGVPVSVKALSAVDLAHWHEEDAMRVPGGYINYRNSPESVGGRSAPITMPGSEFLYLSVPDDPAMADYQRLPCALLVRDYAQARRILAGFKPGPSAADSIRSALYLSLEAIVTTRGEATQSAAYLATPKDIRNALFEPLTEHKAMLARGQPWADAATWERVAAAGQMAAPALSRHHLQKCKAFEPARLADFPLPPLEFELTYNGLNKKTMQLGP